MSEAKFALRVGVRKLRSEWIAMIGTSRDTLILWDDVSGAPKEFSSEAEAMRAAKDAALDLHRKIQDAGPELDLRVNEMRGDK